MKSKKCPKKTCCKPVPRNDLSLSRAPPPFRGGFFFLKQMIGAIIQTEQMPIYEYQHPKTKKVIEVIQGMNDKHIFIDDQGAEWHRIWSVPNAAIDSDIDPFSKSDFLKATAKKGMTAGDMMDLSEKLSEKREKSRGLDPIKNDTVTAYEKKTGKPHPNKSK